MLPHPQSTKLRERGRESALSLNFGRNGIWKKGNNIKN